MDNGSNAKEHGSPPPFCNVCDKRNSHRDDENCKHVRQVKRILCRQDVTLFWSQDGPANFVPAVCSYDENEKSTLSILPGDAEDPSSGIKPLSMRLQKDAPSLYKGKFAMVRFGVRPGNSTRMVAILT